MTSDAPEKEAGEWTEIITPQIGWFDVRLREIWQYRDLVWQFFRRDFVSSYRQTVLGPLWFVLPPLATTLIMAIVFGRVAKVSTDGTPHILFFLLGVTAWNYFASCLTRTATTFTGNAGLFGKVYFPRLTVPVSVVLNNLATFGIQFGVFLAIFIYHWATGAAVEPNWRMVLVPLLLVQMGALGLGMGCMVSALTTRYRDFGMMLSFGVQLWMYVSCVVFPLSSVAPGVRWVFVLNPMVPIIESFRFAFLGRGVIENWQLALSFGISGVVLFLGLLMFHHVERTFTDTV